MARSRTGAPALGVMLGLAAALAGCETSDRDRDRDDDRGQGDVLGGILGGVLGGGGSGSGSGSGSGGGGILGRSVDFRCDDGRRFTASFQPFGQGVSVDTDRRTYRLYPREGGGGDRDRREYRSEDGDVRLEVDGDRAELSVEDGDDYEDCEAR